MQINGVKFLQKGVKDAEGKYYPVYYSMTGLIDGRLALTVYARSLVKGLPAALSPQNNSDCQTDYFEEDIVRFSAGTPEFEQLAAHVMPDNAIYRQMKQKCAEEHAARNAEMLADAKVNTLRLKPEIEARVHIW